MSDEFFVDADGLTSGSNGFAQKAAELQTLAQHIRSLADPGRVEAAAGYDDNGRAFASIQAQATDGIVAGLDAWAKAVDATTGAVLSMAESFRDVDKGANDVVEQLHKGIEEVGRYVGGSTGGGEYAAVATPADGAGPPPAPTHKPTT